MDQQSLVEDLNRQIANDDVVVVAGTGVAIMASEDQQVEGYHVARWDGLLSHGVEYCLDTEHVIEPEDAELLRLQIKRGKDFLIAAAEHITSALIKKSPGAYRGWLNRTLGRLQPKSPEVLQALACLGGVLATLNYDALFERSADRSTITWQDRDKLESVLREEMNPSNTVIHLHGYYEQPESVVLGLRSYDKVANDPHAEAVLRLFALAKTFLFVGCRGTVNDPNFGRLVEWATAALKDSTHRHYLLCRAADLEAIRAELKAAHWLYPVVYGRDFKELVPFLRKLARSRPDANKPIAKPAIVIPGFDLDLYRAAMRKRYGRLKLEELDPTSHDIEKPLTLTGMFIPQEARECAEYLPRVFELPKEVQRRLHQRGEIDTVDMDERLVKEHRRVYHEQAPRPVLELVDDPALNRLVVLGDPGSGKSTLLQYLLLQWVEKPAASPDPLPLLVELREYARLRQEGKVSGFLQFIQEGESVRCHLDREQLQSWLRENPSLVLFDGLDEVFDLGLRSEVATAIHRFADDYADRVRIIVTSRVVGYRHQTWQDEGFRHFMLQELEEPQIGEFLNRWHRAAYNKPVEGNRKRELLERAIADSTAIRQLAGNPLLLTMMAILNRTQELPRDRSELYEQCARLLLHQWKADAAFAQDEALRGATLDYKDKRELLMLVARAMQETERGLAANLISEHELEDALAKGLSRYPNLRADRGARALIEQLRGRNFMLCSAGGANYAFVHRTFLEYFCASELRLRFEQQQTLKLEDLKTAVYGRRWPDETWHEVLCLLAGMLAPRFVREILAFLLQQKDPDETCAHVFLAARCVGEVRQRADLGDSATEVRREVEKLTGFDLGHAYEPWDRTPGRDSHISVRAVKLVAAVWAAEVSTKRWLNARAQSDEDWGVRWAAVEALARSWKHDPETLPILKARAQSDEHFFVRKEAISAVARGWKHDPETLPWLKARVQSDENVAVSAWHGPLEAMARDWKDDPEEVRWVKIRAQSDENWVVRETTIETMARGWKDDPETLPWLKARVQSNERWAVREAAVRALAEGWKDDPDTLPMLKARAQSDKHWGVRQTAIETLARDWKHDPEILPLLKARAQSDRHWGVRQLAIKALARGWRDDPETLPWLKTRAQSDDNPAVRRSAVRQLAWGWKDDPETLHWLEAHASD